MYKGPKSTRLFKIRRFSLYISQVGISTQRLIFELEFELELDIIFYAVVSFKVRSLSITVVRLLVRDDHLTEKTSANRPRYLDADDLEY